VVDPFVVTCGEKVHAKVSGCGTVKSGWALLMIWMDYSGYTMATDSTVNMQALTCRVDAASARGGALHSRAFGLHAWRPMSAVHTCGEGNRKSVRVCSLAHLGQYGHQLSCGRWSRIGSRPHRFMLKFESLPRPAIRATCPCRMRRKPSEISTSLTWPRSGHPCLRARSLSDRGDLDSETWTLSVGNQPGGWSSLQPRFLVGQNTPYHPPPRSVLNRFE